MQPSSFFFLFNLWPVKFSYQLYLILKLNKFYAVKGKWMTAEITSLAGLVLLVVWCWWQTWSNRSTDRFYWKLANLRGFSRNYIDFPNLWNCLKQLLQRCVADTHPLIRFTCIHLQNLITYCTFSASLTRFYSQIILNSNPINSIHLNTLFFFQSEQRICQIINLIRQQKKDTAFQFHSII